MTIHKTKMTEGTDCRNYIVRCECGWAYSSTRADCLQQEIKHRTEDSQFRWGDERRRFEKSFRWGDKTSGAA